ncbi:hypothetical protein HID58_017978, partial [Brassica napus]
SVVFMNAAISVKKITLINDGGHNIPETMSTCFLVARQSTKSETGTLIFVANCNINDNESNAKDSSLCSSIIPPSETDASSAVLSSSHQKDPNFRRRAQTHLLSRNINLPNSPPPGRFLLCLLAKVIVSCPEKLVDEGRTFDAVLALEVIQHVANPANPSEYILQWLPKGCTHQWSSFLTPEELTMILQRTSLDDCSSGEGDGWICIQPDNRKMVIVTDDIGVNFIAYGTKKE